MLLSSSIDVMDVSLQIPPTRLLCFRDSPFFFFPRCELKRVRRFTLQTLAVLWRRGEIQFGKSSGSVKLKDESELPSLLRPPSSVLLPSKDSAGFSGKKKQRLTHTLGYLMCTHCALPATWGQLTCFVFCFFLCVFFFRKVNRKPIPKSLVVLCSRAYDNLPNVSIMWPTSCVKPKPQVGHLFNAVIASSSIEINRSILHSIGFVYIAKVLYIHTSSTFKLKLKKNNNNI